MDGNIEVSDMCMALRIKHDIIWFQITTAPVNDQGIPVQKNPTDE
jgi:hypothetical protein